MDHALFAIDQNLVAVQGLGRDAFAMDHQRNGQRPRDNRGVRTDRAFFKHDPRQFPPIGQQFTRSDVARDQDRVLGHLGAGFMALTGQDAQQPVGKVIQILQPFAQIGVRHGLQARARDRLFLFNRGLGAEAAIDVLFHPAHPAARIGEHAIGLKHLQLFGVAGAGDAQHFIDRNAQLIDGLLQTLLFRDGVIGHGVRHHHTWFMQPDVTGGDALLATGAAEQFGTLVQSGQAGFLTHKGTQFGHLGQNHRDDL